MNTMGMNASLRGPEYARIVKRALKVAEEHGHVLSPTILPQAMDLMYRDAAKMAETLDGVVEAGEKLQAELEEERGLVQRLRKQFSERTEYYVEDVTERDAHLRKVVFWAWIWGGVALATGVLAEHFWGVVS